MKNIMKKFNALFVLSVFLLSIVPLAFAQVGDVADAESDAKVEGSIVEVKKVGDMKLKTFGDMKLKTLKDKRAKAHAGYLKRIKERKAHEGAILSKDKFKAHHNAVKDYFLTDLPNDAEMDQKHAKMFEEYMRHMQGVIGKSAGILKHYIGYVENNQEGFDAYGGVVDKLQAHLDDLKELDAELGAIEAPYTKEDFDRVEKIGKAVRIKFSVIKEISQKFYKHHRNLLKNHIVRGLTNLIDRLEDRGADSTKIREIIEIRDRVENFDERLTIDLVREIRRAVMDAIRD